MGLTGSVAPHPAQFSPEVLEVLAELIVPGEHVHDPFAGLGLRLGQLCDKIGTTFTGTDLEDWPGRDPRVAVDNSTARSSYPAAPFVVVTSPVYFDNRISSDYVEGPTPSTKMNGRRAYGISLGRALHPLNLARSCRPASREAYYAGHALAVRHWGERAIVNVDLPMTRDWEALLRSQGYERLHFEPVDTRRYRVPGHGDVRADHEVVIVAMKGAK